MYKLVSFLIGDLLYFWMLVSLTTQYLFGSWVLFINTNGGYLIKRKEGSWHVRQIYAKYHPFNWAVVKASHVFSVRMAGGEGPNKYVIKSKMGIVKE